MGRHAARGRPCRSLLAEAFRHSRVMGGQAVQADVFVMPAGDDALVTGVAVADFTMDLREQLADFERSITLLRDATSIDQ